MRQPRNHGPLSVSCLFALSACLPWGPANTCDPQTWYLDFDGDGFGAPYANLRQCNEPAGYVSVGSDCDDGDSAINPSATEVCDNADIDENCNGVADDEDPTTTGQRIWYRDDDHDLFGATESGETACDPPDGFVAVDGDCDDADNAVNPGAEEICDNGIDDDCDESAAGCGWGGADSDSDVPAYVLVALEESVTELTGGAWGWYDVDRGCGTSWTDGRFGETTATPGDVDDDGRDDIVIAAPYADYSNSCDSDSRDNEGILHLYHSYGSASLEPYSEFDTTGYAYPDDDEWENGGETYRKLGFKMADGGNLCGDTPSVVASAPWGDSNHSGSDENGFVFLLCIDSNDISIPTTTIQTTNNGGMQLGYGLTVTDIDGDRQDDLALSATYKNRVLVFAGPLDDAGELSAVDDADLIVTGQDISDGSPSLGCCKTGILAADLTGDDLPDLVLSDTDAVDDTGTKVGAIYGFAGPFALNGSTSDAMELGVDDATWTLFGEQENALTGTSITRWADADGSGTLVIAADWYDRDDTTTGSGIVYLVDDPGVLSGPHDLASTVAGSLLGHNTDDMLGYPVNAEGDFNDDGHPDLLLTAREAEPSEDWEDPGIVYLLYGPPSAAEVGPMTEIGDAADVQIIGADQDYLGESLTVLDANGDGFDDLAMGATQGGYDYGKVYILFGVGY